MGQAYYEYAPRVQGEGWQILTEGSRARRLALDFKAKLVALVRDYLDREVITFEGISA